MAYRRRTATSIKNPCHPGEIIREDILGALGLDVTQGAEVLAVGTGILSDVLHCKAPVSADIALRLERAFGIRMEMLLKMQAAYDAAQACRGSHRIKVKR